MPQISKQIVRELIETLDVCGVGVHHIDLLALLDQPEGEPVAWDAGTDTGLTRYITETKYKKFTPAIQRFYKPFKCSSCYTHLPAPRKPITADDVTDEMIDELARKCPTMNSVEVDRQTIAASVNIYNDMKEQK